MLIQINFVEAPLGHEIQGVNLAGEIDDELFAEIETAYNTYGVICFRRQTLTPEQHITFSKRFGPLDKYIIDKYLHPQYPEIFVVSNVIKNGKPLGMADAGRYWHSDMWSKPCPPRGAIMNAIEVPHSENGTPLGDTLFASTAAAYDALPEDLLRRIDGRKALYTSAAANEFRRLNSPNNERTRESAAAREALPNIEIEHSLVRIHPLTGRKCLYLSEGMVANISGYDQEESKQLCAELLAHMISSRFVYRHRWKVGDVIMWDNFSSIHKAIGDFDLPHHRLMHRTTLSAASLYKYAMTDAEDCSAPRCDKTIG